MFSEIVDESWESSSFQDAFIENYFGGDKSTSSKKNARKRRITSEITNATVNSDGASGAKKSKLLKNATSSKFAKVKESFLAKKECIVGKSKKLKEKLLHSSPVCNSGKKKKKQSKQNESRASFNDVTDSSLIQSPQTEYSSLNDSGASVVQSPTAKKKLFQDKAFQKLQAAKFRYLNELLYTNTGKFSLEYFNENTDEFTDYHEGYQSQVTKWPMNPVDVIIKELKKKKHLSVIADLGCGEAKIAEELQDRTVHSFDLVSLKKNVIPCDMAKVPLPGESVDAAVFCLSLMGTNWKEYLLEGHRILKLEGEMKIAEIESRIEDQNYFIKCIEQCGFHLINKNVSHKMFVFFNFQKVKRTVKASKIKTMSLKPCLYKKR